MRCLTCGDEFHRPPSAKSQFCSRPCWYAAKASRAIPLAERLWRRVDVSGGPDACWEWQGARLPSGYGSISSGTTPARRLVTSRVAYEDKVGPIPPGLIVCHKCDNPPCVNPAHLFLGTIRDNSEDMVAKSRSTAGERHGGAKLTNADVALIRAALAGGMTGRELARRFGVQESTISQYRNGRRRA